LYQKYRGAAYGLIAEAVMWRVPKCLYQCAAGKRDGRDNFFKGLIFPNLKADKKTEGWLRFYRRQCNHKKRGYRAILVGVQLEEDIWYSWKSSGAAEAAEWTWRAR
jgi:hypothetical protein